MNLKVFSHELVLRHTWRIARGAADSKRYHYVAVTAEGVTGYGEAAHNARYDETLDSIHDFLQQAADLIRNSDPWHYRELIASLRQLQTGQQAAKAAVDMALLDWIASRLSVPLYRLWGVNPARTPVTSYSIGIDRPEVMQRKIEEASEFPILKIKLGTADDRQIMQTVSAATDRKIRVDANEGWTTREQALENIQWLAEFGTVEFVEQPMPAGRLQDLKWLRERSPLPLVADEEVRDAGDIFKLVGCYDGINLKVMKAGGLLETLKMIEIARTLDLKIMLGCMIESSLGITAAAHLSPLVDWADLDGNLLIKNDPFTGVKVEAGKLILPTAPGIGAKPLADA